MTTRQSSSRQPASEASFENAPVDSSSSSANRKSQRPNLPSLRSFMRSLDPAKALDTTLPQISPPGERPSDSFSSPGSMSPVQHTLTPTSLSYSTRAPISPPVSPEFQNTISGQVQTAIRDPILYPAGHIPETSLFPSEADTRELVEHHVATRAGSVFRSLSPPQKEDYTLMLEFKSQMGRAVVANPRNWRRRELAQLKEDNSIRSGRRSPFYSTSTTAPEASSRRKIGKKPQVGRPAVDDSSKNVLRSVKTARVKKNDGQDQKPETGKKAVREDKDFESLPDYSPPLWSLPDKVNSLKVDWKGAPIDLKSDPNVKLLHPDEIHLASNLRLDCATYLTSKRRIFTSRIAASKIGKQFRKTDAQQACKIDVNKASKLWQAFDKAGWFHPRWLPKNA